MKGKHKFKVTREFITTKCVLGVVGIIFHTEFHLKLILSLLFKHSNSSQTQWEKLVDRKFHWFFFSA